MKLKCTALFQHVTNTGAEGGVLTTPAPITRVGGWSESWYLDAETVSPDDRFRRVNLARAALLPIGCSIIGQRYQMVEPVGSSQTGSFVYPGTAGTLADVPQMALFCRVHAVNAINIRPAVLRGIPDARAVRGEYNPSDAYTKAISLYFGELATWGFKFRGRDLSAPQLPLIHILADGSVQTEVAHTYVVGDMVQVLRAVGADGRKRGGRFQVTAVLNSFHFSINWNQLFDSTGGRVRKDLGYSYYDIVTPVDIRGVTVKRVGRPFFQYRGRRSNRPRQ